MAHPDALAEVTFGNVNQRLLRPLSGHPGFAPTFDAGRIPATQ